MNKAQPNQTKIGKKIWQLKKIHREIDQINSNGQLKVSDHAMLRYLERVLEIDLKQIEGYILSENIKSMVSKLGTSGKFPHENGFQVVIKNNIVTTIIK